MKFRTMEVDAGTRIETACKKAVEKAKNERIEIHFSFNDIGLIASPTSNPDVLVVCFHEECDRLAREWEESEYGKLAKSERERQIESKQKEIDHLISILPTLSELFDVIEWLERFTPEADDIGVNFDKESLAKTFENLGYIQSEYVGAPKKAFKDSNVIGRYIVGQAINCLRKGMPPHPTTLKFSEDFFQARRIELGMKRGGS